MALYGSTVPTDHGEFVVTIICPNAYAHQRLMQACAGIVPEAGISVPIVGMPPNCDGIGNTSAEPSEAEQAAALLRARMEQDDDAAREDVSSDPAYGAGGTD